jgi:hypothetical protein
MVLIKALHHDMHVSNGILALLESSKLSLVVFPQRISGGQRRCLGWASQLLTTHTNGLQVQ